MYFLFFIFMVVLLIRVGHFGMSRCDAANTEAVANEFSPWASTSASAPVEQHTHTDILLPAAGYCEPCSFPSNKEFCQQQWLSCLVHWVLGAVLATTFEPFHPTIHHRHHLLQGYLCHLRMQTGWWTRSNIFRPTL